MSSLTNVKRAEKVILTGQTNRLEQPTNMHEHEWANRSRNSPQFILLAPGFILLLKKPTIILYELF